jgi:hypothetical protein
VDDLDYRKGDSHGGDEYWARKPSEELYQNLLSRSERYFRDFRNSPFSQQIYRNWLYYHGLFSDQDDYNLFDGAIERHGSQGEYAFLGANHFRNILHHLFVLTVRDMPSPAARAANANPESLKSTQVADALVEQYFREKHVEDYLVRAAEEAIVLTRGYVTVQWDDMLGTLLGGQEDEGGARELNYTGDLRFRTPTLMDVVYDQQVVGWQDKCWCVTRELANKWELAETYPEKANELLSASDSKDLRWDIFSSYQRDDEHDYVSLWTFWHRRTPAMPFGRQLQYTQTCYLSNDVLPDFFPDIPVYECSPADVLLTNLGYSPGFDLAGPQEAYNMTISNILTNHDALGVQSLWSPPGNALSAAQIQGGMRILQCKQKPEPLQLVSNPQDAYKFLETLSNTMELISGINSVTRGQPEASLKSGKALSIIETKAVQYASVLIRSWHRLIEDVATCMVRVLGAKMKEGDVRVIEIAGKFNSAAMEKEYTRSDLLQVDRVVVDSGNPLQRTLSGRLQLAEYYMDKGWVRSPEQIEQVATTGRLEPLFQADQAQLSLIASEKDALLDGEVAPVLKSDHHSLHLKEELALLNTPDVRRNEALASNVLGHCAVHLAMLYLPDVIDLQIAQGYQVPQLSPILPPGTLENIGPDYQGFLKDEDLSVLVQPPPPQAPPPQGGENAPNEPQLQAIA